MSGASLGPRWASLAIGGVLAVAACGPGRPAPEPPRPGMEVEGDLPPIPFQEGPLTLDVVYPGEGAAIAVRDSNFIYGSTGTGTARLRINGTPVRVEPNGAFLAFLPVPVDGVYRVEATTETETSRLHRRVRLPPLPPMVPLDSAVIVANSIEPNGAWTAVPGEAIPVRFQGTPGGTATLVLPDGTRVPLAERRVVMETDDAIRAFTIDTTRLVATPARGIAEYRGTFEAQPLAAPHSGLRRPALADASWLPTPAGAPAVVELVVGGDTARAALPLNLALLDPTRPPVGITYEPDPLGETGDGVVVGRPGPELTYLYFWPTGTKLALTGERNEEYRVRLTPELTAWVPTRKVRLLPAGTPPPAGRVGTVRFTPGPISVDVRLSVDDRFPFRVDEGERTLQLTLYGATADTDWMQYGRTDPLIRWAEWSQPADDVYRLTLHLDGEPWGYQTHWAENGDLVLRVRRPPEIDEGRPLRGLLVAIDPGHPPSGAIGPTRWTEAQANLAIALRLRPLLEEAGARVLMTRTDMTPVPLQARPYMATAADADILVSIHNNAFPDGINPFENNGTSTYYFHRHSVDLARSLQNELLDELRLRDLGIGRANLALVRPTWMPAALTESMYMMIPRQEAALRDAETLERIARAHLRGLESFVLGRVQR